MVQAQTPTLAFLRQFDPRWKSGPERGVFRCRRCVPKSTAESSPTATSSEPVIERVQGLLSLSCLNSEDLDVTARWNQRPAFSGKSAVYGILDPVDQERVFRLDLFPRVGLVLPEVCAVIVIGLHLLCRRLAREQKHHPNQNEREFLHV